jgi:hypothetical protein
MGTKIYSLSQYTDGTFLLGNKSGEHYDHITFSEVLKISKNNVIKDLTTYPETFYKIS